MGIQKKDHHRVKSSRSRRRKASKRREELGLFMSLQIASTILQKANEEGFMSVENRKLYLEIITFERNMKSGSTEKNLIIKN